jgi:hypothetical protein
VYADSGPCQTSVKGIRRFRRVPKNTVHSDVTTHLFVDHHRSSDYLAAVSNNGSYQHNRAESPFRVYMRNGLDALMTKEKAPGVLKSLCTVKKLNVSIAKSIQHVCLTPFLPVTN